MTFVIGQAFDAFARFPLTPNPPTQAKDDLLRGVGFAALELVGLAVGSLALSSVTSSLWIWSGEMNVMALRKAVYLSVTAKDMSWFDTHMGMADGNKLTRTDENDGPIGAGGLMAKFTRETDDVRMATSLASGMLIQYLTTCLTCLVLAFTRSWALTLVILSTVPIPMLIQGISSGLASPPRIRAPTIRYRCYHHRPCYLRHLHRPGIQRGNSRPFSRGCSYSPLGQSNGKA